MANEQKSRKQKRCKYLETNWISEMTENLVRLNPDLDRSEIEDYVIKTYFERYRNHDCMLSNSYENTVAYTSLGEIADWVETNKPLVSESGVFFYQKKDRRNLNVEIIKEDMLDARDVDKARMFEALKKDDLITAGVMDIRQGNDKKAANSGYGAEGQSSSFLYNPAAAMSVTAAARSQLSTMALCFENLFADNVKFWNMDEFFTFITHTLREKDDWKYDTFDVVDEVPSKGRWVHRYGAKFLHESLCDVESLEAIYDSLDDEQRTRTYYKANLHEFLLRNETPRTLFEEIADSECDFINPNEVPEEISKPIEELNRLVVEFVNYRYCNFRYQDKTRYFRRKAVLLMDTDSAFIYYDSIMRFVIDRVLPFKLLKKGKKKMYELKIMNTLSTFASSCLAATLWNYLGYIHVPEEERPRVRAKNEYFYPRVVITCAKKSYIGYQGRKESVVFAKPKMDTKGISFFKSTSSEKTTDFINKELLIEEIFEPEDGRISLPRIYRKISDFQKQITKDIAAGDIGFMKRSIKVKSPDAYAEPLRIGAYKGVYVWNMVNSEQDAIQCPATVTQVKVLLRNKQDVAKLAPWPNIYERMMWLFDHEPEIGDHIEKNKKGEDKLVKGKGIKSIAVPNDYDELPDWIIPIIDVNTLVENNMSLMGQLLLSLSFVSGRTTHSGAQAKYYTNIVRV